MSKYYVQCGPIRVLLSSTSLEQAALSALDRSLQSHLWIYDDPGLTEANCRDHLMLEALCHLDSTIRVSERGFDREDAREVGTPETIDRWHRLMVGMNRLFLAAGLTPRPMAAVATGESSDAVPAPRLPR